MKKWRIMQTRATVCQSMGCFYDAWMSLSPSSTISYEWVMFTPPRASMIEAEQYFSALSSTARFT